MARKVVDANQMNFEFAAEEESGEAKTVVKSKAGKKPQKGSKGNPEAGTIEIKPLSQREKKTVIVKRKTSGRARKSVETIQDDQIESKALSMAAKQRDISVSEFFAKNRHLLGFDNPSKALLTTIKEAVDNSLDACEEAQILPEIEVGIEQRAENRYRIWVQDNGPGIVKEQIPNIFGRLLYGSKFHNLRMARGQQGIGISAAGMYGMLTTGKNVKINSKTGPRAKSHHYELRIDTKANRPEIINDEEIEWDVRSGTRVEMEIEARYQRGRQSVDEYLYQTAIANPHARFIYRTPDNKEIIYDRSIESAVVVPEAVKPHPYGVELGILIKMLQDTPEKTVSAFLTNEFSRVSSRVSQEILDQAKLSARKRPNTFDHNDVEKLYKSINETKIMAPSTNCVVPIGEEELLQGLQQVVKADFYTVCTRPPAVYRGNPFQIEAALAFGKGTNGNKTPEEMLDEEESQDEEGNELMRVLRFANRVPLLYQQSACAMFKSIVSTNWRQYGLSQSRGALPAGPATVIIHIASVWVPFTSESKEAVAHYPEIIKEIKLALSECGRRLGRYLAGEKRAVEEIKKRGYIHKYLPPIGEALRDILKLNDKQINKIIDDLRDVLEDSRTQKV